MARNENGGEKVFHVYRQRFIHTIHTKTPETRKLKVAFVDAEEICGSPQQLNY
jgi:hypothetical protein